MFEDLESVKTPRPLGESMVWWMGGLMGEIMSNH